LDLVWIPAGRFVMGALDETPDEQPMHAVRIEEGFWMSRTEIDNRIFKMYDPTHHSRFFIGACESLEPRRMESLDDHRQPVVRVSWADAMGFCDWLSRQARERVDLPTEAEWEWACRAGTERGFPDWTPGRTTQGVAHCAGLSLGAFHDWKSLANRVFDRDWDDGTIATGEVDSNQPNAWGLHNMHGNAAEWTKSRYRSYPYAGEDGRNGPGAEGRRVVRGGSFSDRPKRCTASYRLGYQPWQGVYNVGFRVVVRTD
jgi:formylglycine-generating enzyme required for sulfatase activity